MITTIVSDFYGVLWKPGINQELLDFYKSLKPKTTLHIFTSARDLNFSEIEGIFGQIISGEKEDLRKQDPSAYLVVAEKIGKMPEEILYIDDLPENIEAAKKAGMQTILYTRNEEVMKEIRSSIN